MHLQPVLKFPFFSYRINVKKIAFGNKEHTTEENGSFGFVETLHKQ